MTTRERIQTFHKAIEGRQDWWGRYCRYRLERLAEQVDLVPATAEKDLETLQEEMKQHPPAPPPRPSPLQALYQAMREREGLVLPVRLVEFFLASDPGKIFADESSLLTTRAEARKELLRQLPPIPVELPPPPGVKATSAAQAGRDDRTLQVLCLLLETERGRPRADVIADRKLLLKARQKGTVGKTLLAELLQKLEALAARQEAARAQDSPSAPPAADTAPGPRAEPTEGGD